MARGSIEKRGSRKRKVKPVVLIVTEGAKTEPGYFNHFRIRQKNIDVRVVGSRTSAGETDYNSLIRKAKEYRDKSDLSSENGDTIWIVADGDVNYNNPNPIEKKDIALTHARKLAKQKGMEMIISNPCFELWYLLHFRYTTGFLKDYEAVRKLLVEHIPNYEKADDVFLTLENNLGEAGQRARKLEEYHLRNGRVLPLGITANPFTEVHHLIETLVS